MTTLSYLADGFVLEFGRVSLLAHGTPLIASMPIWWGADNLLVVARNAPGPPLTLDPLLAATGEPAAAALRRLGISSREELARRRVASFAATREVLGPGPLLRDDRPTLEVLASRRRPRPPHRGELELVELIAPAIRTAVEGVGAAGLGDEEGGRSRKRRFHEKASSVKSPAFHSPPSRPGDIRAALKAPTTLPSALFMIFCRDRCTLRFVGAGRCHLLFDLSRSRVQKCLAVPRTRCG